MSQPPKTRSSILASGTKSWILGVRASVRLPSRTVPNCVREPIGWPSPRFIASTPAINVVLTAPMPGIKMPNFPSAGAIVVFPLVGKLGISLGTARGLCSTLEKAYFPYAILSSYDTPRDKYNHGGIGGRRAACARRTLLSAEGISRRGIAGLGTKRVGSHQIDRKLRTRCRVPGCADARTGRLWRDSKATRDRRPAAPLCPRHGLRPVRPRSFPLGGARLSAQADRERAAGGGGRARPQ